MKKISFVVFVFIASFLLVLIIPVFAKDFNIPEGYYRSYFSEGIGIIETPANWPPGGVHPNALRIDLGLIEDATIGAGEYIGIHSAYPVGNSIVWLPIAYFSTNPNAIPYIRTILSGMPAALSTNSKLLSEDVLKVERHGNRMYGELNVPQSIIWMKLVGGYQFISIPAFTMELDNVGGSFHEEDTVVLTGYAGASNYTHTSEVMGFKAEGTITIDAWGYTAHSMTDCAIAMHGISTYIPP